MRVALTVRRSNDDRRDDRWEWVLLDSGQVVAVSQRSYTTEQGAWRAVRRIVAKMRSGVGIIAYVDGAS